MTAKKPSCKKTAAKTTANPKVQTFPAGPKGIVSAVKTAKQRGEKSITFVLKK